MALRGVRSWIRKEGAIRGRPFRSHPRIGNVVVFGAVSAVAFAYGAAALLRGEQRLEVFAGAVLFGLYAWDNWRRWTSNESEPESGDSERAASEPVETWQCVACGELLDKRFDSCWNCNSDRERALHASRNDPRT